MQSDTKTLPNPATLGDLPMEMLLMIYKNLNFEQLVNIAKTNPNNRHAANIIFKDKFFKSKFVIKIKDYSNITVFYDQVVEQIDFDLLVNIFKMFGQSISNLSVDYRYLAQGETEERLNKQISEDFSDSLKEFQLFCAYNVSCTLGLQKPFKKVETMHLAKEDNGYLDFNINFSEMFPIVRYLSLYQVHYGNLERITHHFPHLETMAIDSWTTNAAPNLAKIFQLNPQIQYLKINTPNDFFWNWQKKIYQIYTVLTSRDIMLMEVQKKFVLIM